MRGDDSDLTLAIHSPITLSIISAPAVHAQGEEEATMTGPRGRGVADWLIGQVNSPSGELITADYWTVWQRLKVQNMDLGVSIGPSICGHKTKFTACVFKADMVMHRATADTKKAATHLAAKWAWHTYWRDIAAIIGETADPVYTSTECA